MCRKLAIAEEELIGNWELIDLSYAYAVMKESANMTLTADHKVSGGSWDGADWNFDATNGILTVGETEPLPEA